MAISDAPDRITNSAILFQNNCETKSLAPKKAASVRPPFIKFSSSVVLLVLRLIFTLLRHSQTISALVVLYLVHYVVNEEDAAA